MLIGYNFLGCTYVVRDCFWNGYAAGLSYYCSETWNAKEGIKRKAIRKTSCRSSYLCNTRNNIWNVYDCRSAPNFLSLMPPAFHLGVRAYPQETQAPTRMQEQVIWPSCSNSRIEGYLNGYLREMVPISKRSPTMANRTGDSQYLSILQ